MLVLLSDSREDAICRIDRSLGCSRRFPSVLMMTLLIVFLHIKLWLQHAYRSYGGRQRRFQNLYYFPVLYNALLVKVNLVVSLLRTIWVDRGATSWTIWETLLSLSQLVASYATCSCITTRHFMKCTFQHIIHLGVLVHVTILPLLHYSTA